MSRQDLSKLHPLMRDNSNKYRIQSLFFETKVAGVEERYPPLFTLKEYDHTYKGVTYPSMRKIYLGYDHVPGYEYEFAMDVFGSWEHWLRLCDSNALKPYIQSWRDELDIRIKANAMKHVIEASRVDDPKGLQAARYLADKGYGTKRGRPSKEEVAREKKIAAGVRDSLEEDMERLGLSVLEGGK